MAFVVMVALFTAWLLVAQAVHILKTGDPRWFIVPHKVNPKSLNSRTKFAGVLMYGLSGCAVAVLLAFEAVTNRHAVAFWFAEHLGNVVGGLTLIWMGLSGAVRPQPLLSKLKAAYLSESDEFSTKSAIYLIRGLGLLVFAFGLLLLFS